MVHSHSRTALLRLTMLTMLVAASQAQAQPGSQNTLPLVADLFLGSWAATSTTESGKKVASELTFRWTLDKNFLEVRNSIDGDGESGLYALTVYGWQPVLGKVVFWTFDKDGTILEGMAQLETGAVTHQWRSFTKAGEIRDGKSKLERIAEDKIAFTMFDRNGSEMFSLEYKRKGSK